MLPLKALLCWNKEVRGKSMDMGQHAVAVQGDSVHSDDGNWALRGSRHPWQVSPYTEYLRTLIGQIYGQERY